MVYVEIPPPLQVFLKFQQQEPVRIPVEHQEHQTVKDLAESCGIPHVEIGCYRADGKQVSSSARVDDGAVITLEISQHIPQGIPSFILDVHMTRLAKYLRILGFDCAYRGDYEDAEIARKAEREGRVVLTRDRGLLKRKRIIHGYWVRSQIPKRQLEEVSRRFQLSKWQHLDSRCSHCNSPMLRVEKEQVREVLPYYTNLSYHEFFQCKGCGQVYWEGAHYPKIMELKKIAFGCDPDY